MITKKFLSLRVRAIAVVGLSTLMATVGWGGMTEQVRQQIAQIESVKDNFTSAQRKLDSGLAFGALASRGQIPLHLTGTDTNPHIPTNAKALVEVQIIGKMTTSLESFVRKNGGVVKSTDDRTHLMVAAVPIGKADVIAGHSDVRSMSVSLGPTLNNPVSSPNLYSSGLAGLNMKVGALTSQGYIAHGANVAVAHGYNGTGIKVGVLSDSALPAEVAALIATGDLPAGVTVLPGQAGPTNGTNEGTAMMEIVHDLAPGAQIYFATAYNSVASFAANIIALKDAGCKVIVDDVSYYNEGVFQDGPIAQAVNTVTAAGVSYFSSAANSGNKDSGTSGCYEGDFVNGGAVAAPVTGVGQLNDFGGGQTFDRLTASTTVITLKWSDPLGGSSNDYDLFVLNPAGTAITAVSAGAQTGTQDPYEAVGKSNGFAVNSQIVVVKRGGAATRALHLDTNRGALSIGTAGVIYGHNGGASTISTAATYWNSAKTGVVPFTGFANPIETFSSDGPRRVFYTPAGVAITPGNVLFGTAGGTLLAKPDITAADGVFTKTPGFLPFFGTSAAAPHAAAIAALVLQARPTYTPAQVKAALQNTALDTMAVGYDRDSGAGIAMAWPAVQYALAHP